jgi:hypothetical protein
LFPFFGNLKWELCPLTFSLICILLLLLWLYSPLLGLGRFLSFLIIYTVGRPPWTGDQPVARPLPTHRATQTQNKRARFEHFERAKTVHALSGIRTHDCSILSERRQFMP